MDNPFHVTVYDKHFERLGWCNAPLWQSWIPRHNQQPTGQITVLGATKAARNLAQPGSRVVVEYRGAFLMSGVTRLQQVAGAGAKRQMTFQVQDDYRLLSRILGWPVPGAPLSGQSASEFRTVKGPAETVFKTLVAENAARLGLPVTVAPSQGRGAVISVQIRMQSLVDVLMPLVDQAGIGVTVHQSGAGFRVDCYEPQIWPHTLSETAATVSDLSYDRSPPEVTRVVVGGPGEGTARIFRSRVNAAAEALYGDVIEKFVDARDIRDDDPDRLALMDARGDEALAEGAATAGLNLDLAETKVFRYGRPGVLVGDRVRVEIDPGVVLQDVIRSAALGFSSEGPSARPEIGQRRDDPNLTLVNAVAAANKAIRDLRRR